MATQKTCDLEGCGKPATCRVRGEAHIFDAVYPGSKTGVAHEADSCAEHTAQLRAICFERANSQLEAHLPGHIEMTRLQDERHQLEPKLREAVATRDSYAIGSKAFAKAQKEVERLTDLLSKNEQAWNENQEKYKQSH